MVLDPTFAPPLGISLKVIMAATPSGNELDPKWTLFTPANGLVL